MWCRLLDDAKKAVSDAADSIKGGADDAKKQL